MANGVVELDDLRIDLARQRVSRAGVELEVAGLSFQLLRHLLAQGDRVVGFDELIARVWAPAVVNEETVTQRVKLLRQALGDDGRNPRYVRSVRGQGYQLCSPPREVGSIQAGAPPSRLHTRPALIAAALLAALGLAIAASKWRNAGVVASVPNGSPASAHQAGLLERARYYASIGQTENNERAIGLYEEVLRLDAANASATVGLSRALSARMCLFNGEPASAARAQSLAEALVARAPADSAAHDALAYALDCRGEIDAAIGEYEQAVALDPGARADSRASVANLYLVKGRLADALEADVAVRNTGATLRFLDLQIARALDLLGFAAQAEQRYADLFHLYPDNVFANAAYPRFLFSQGRYAEAEAVLTQALQRPPHPDLLIVAGELALLRGHRGDAADAFDKAAALRPHQSLPRTLEHLHAEHPQQDWIDAQLAQPVPAGDADAFLERALLQLARADHAAAIEALRQAVAAGFRDRAYLQNSALFRTLATEPAFADVVDSISRAVVAERRRVLDADWLPADIVNAKTVVPRG